MRLPDRARHIVKERRGNAQKETMYFQGKRINGKAVSRKPNYSNRITYCHLLMPYYARQQ